MSLKWPSKSDLRIMLTGGQKLTARPPRDVSWKLYNQYGPTETTITATSSEVVPDYTDCMLPNIGMPIKNTTFYVLDNELNKTPMGGVGELFIGGDGLAIGYLGDEILTKNSFIQNPYANKKEEMIYKTGDMVRMLPSGELYFMGRTDTQVKIRGFRIELEEITRSTQEIDGVKNAHTAVHIENENKELVCYYVKDKEVENINEAVIKSNLKRKLPNYMIPRYIVELEEILVTENGKIDEKKLPVPVVKTLKSIISTDSSSEIEEHLLDVWKKVLGHSNFSVTDNFFDLGGHSLKIVEMQSLIVEKINVEIPLMTFFEYTTITEISKYINGNLDKTEIAPKANSRASLRKRTLRKRV